QVDVLQPDQAAEAVLVRVDTEVYELVFGAQHERARQARDRHGPLPAARLAGRSQPKLEWVGVELDRRSLVARHEHAVKRSPITQVTGAGAPRLLGAVWYLGVAARQEGRRRRFVSLLHGQVDVGVGTQ